jgi:hypothetical protein
MPESKSAALRNLPTNRFALLSRFLPLLPLLLFRAWAQTSAPVPFSTPTTLVGTGRALPSILDQVQKRFLSAISFEEVPFENPSELSAIITTVNGAPNVILTNPRFDFNVTLDNSAATPYLAAQAVVDAYSATGMRREDQYPYPSIPVPIPIY